MYLAGPGKDLSSSKEQILGIVMRKETPTHLTRPSTPPCWCSTDRQGFVASLGTGCSSQTTASLHITSGTQAAQPNHFPTHDNFSLNRTHVANHHHNSNPLCPKGPEYREHQSRNCSLARCMTPSPASVRFFWKGRRAQLTPEGECKRKSQFTSKGQGSEVSPIQNQHKLITLPLSPLSILSIDNIKPKVSEDAMVCPASPLVQQIKGAATQFLKARLTVSETVQAQ